MTPSKPDGEDHVQRAKHLFLINFGLLVCLILGWILLSSEEDVEPILEEIVIPEEPALGNLELAYLKGEMQALSEHPDTMPEYEEEWVFALSKKEIERDEDFAGLSPLEIDELTLAYFKAYTKYFEDYYESREAWQTGYNYGLKLEPALNDLILDFDVTDDLRKDRDRFETEFEIQSEAQWRLFCKAFCRGLEMGYYGTGEDITAQ